MKSWVGNSAHDTRAKCLVCLEGREAHPDCQTVSERAARDLQTDCGEVLEAMQSKVGALDKPALNTGVRTESHFVHPLFDPLGRSPKNHSEITSKQLLVPFDLSKSVFS
jgi:hypothetical protein